MCRFDTLAVAIALLATSSVACAGGWRKPVPPERQVAAERCPDFSGVYFYPGVEKAEKSCTETIRSGFSLAGMVLVLPALDGYNGGYRKAISPTEVTLRQQGCAALTFEASVADNTAIKPGGKIEYENREWAQTIDLVARRRSTEIEWGEDFLRFHERFRAAGFGAGMEANFLTFTLEKTADGDLVYSFRHDQGHSGRHYRDVRCTLERIR